MNDGLISTIAPGQCWSYRVADGWGHSRLIVGALIEFPSQEPVVCCAVQCAPRRRPDGSIDETTIPFLPMSRSAFAHTATATHGEAALPPEFFPAFADWQDDPRGMTVFTVPFDGFLDRLIALQMAAILGVDPDAANDAAS